MPRRRSRSQTRLFGAGLLLAIVVVVVIVASSGGSSSSSKSRSGPIESIFQDDQLLLYGSTPTVASTLDELKALGVDTVRATVLWRLSAPYPNATTPPSGFNASDPAAYSIGAFGGYDRLVELARARGITVDFNVTAAGPLWAMHQPADEPRYANVYEPSASAYGQFVTALGKRYSGSYTPTAGQAAVLKVAGVPASGPLPRVHFWSIWNEPNQPGWLAPQFRQVGSQKVMLSPVLYRSYVDAGFRALTSTGHTPTSDTILVGELAPEGGVRTPLEDPIPPLDFLEALYCVDGTYKPLTGSAATALGCPAGGGSGFAAAHPGLFDASGFAHHPYSFFLAPSVAYTSPGTSAFIPLISLGRLENALDQIFTAYGSSRHIPIYLTEYGYETNPPNPFRGVPLAKQAAYIDEAQYLAAQDPRVRSMSQFLLRDAGPDPAFTAGSIGYWSTFQTGIEFLDGTRKPSFYAYRIPIWIPSHGAIWGMLRPAPSGSTQRAQIQWRSSPSSAWRQIATVTVGGPSETFTTHLTAPGAGSVRIAWPSPSGQVLHSRAAAVS